VDEDVQVEASGFSAPRAARVRTRDPMYPAARSATFFGAGSRNSKGGEHELLTLEGVQHTFPGLWSHARSHIADPSGNGRCTQGELFMLSWGNARTGSEYAPGPRSEQSC
jgi:hypothetical protein